MHIQAFRNDDPRLYGGLNFYRDRKGVKNGLIVFSRTINGNVIVFNMKCPFKIEIKPY